MVINTRGVGKVPLIDQVVIVNVINTKADWIMNFGGNHQKVGHVFASLDSTRDQTYDFGINHLNCFTQ